MRPALLIFFFCFLCVLLPAQTVKTAYAGNELSFTTENDAYLLQYHDAYYTNGLFLKLIKAYSKNERKRLKSFELGQTIYTPINRSISPISNIDRPYCGYLFLKYRQTDFYKHDAVLQWSASLGLFGKASLGEALQNSYHELFQYKKFLGWDYQVPNALSADFGLLYAQTILEVPNLFKMVPLVQANLGTGFINSIMGSYFCWGLFEQNQSSALWNARVSNTDTYFKHKKELFLYALPQLNFQGYNATIQGGLFSDGAGAVLSKPKPLMFQQNIGLCYAHQHFSTKIEWVYQTREAILQQSTQQYISMQFNYRF